MRPTQVVAVCVISIYTASHDVAAGFLSSRQYRSRVPLFVLWAGKGSSPNKSKQRTPPSSRGEGFGSNSKQSSSISLEPKVKDDYAIFPALESRVRETLVSAQTLENATILPSDDTDSVSQRKRPLPKEVYQRIDQIYGFPSFNYETTAPSSSLAAPSMIDLLATPATSTLDFQTTPPDATILPRALSQLPPFQNIRVLHVDPLVLAIDEFFTADECDRYISASESKSNTANVLQSKSPTVGKDADAKSQRTSTTFYHRYQSVPELVAKASRLLGIDAIDQWEEPQTVRYRRNEKFTWHLDALGPKELNDVSKAGQRVATLLVYLTSLPPSCGGATLFRDLGGEATYLRVQPMKGTALLFFPAAGGIRDCPFDIRTLHSGEVVATDAANDKWIGQLWLRQRAYTPTAPPGNSQREALDAIADYCLQRYSDSSELP